MNLWYEPNLGSVVPLATFLYNPCRLAQAAHCTMPLVSVQGLVQMWPDQQALDGASGRTGGAAISAYALHLLLSPNAPQRSCWHMNITVAVNKCKYKADSFYCPRPPPSKKLIYFLLLHNFSVDQTKRILPISKYKSYLIFCLSFGAENFGHGGLLISGTAVEFMFVWLPR